MFLLKLPWKIFCYFLDGILRVALLGLLVFLLSQQSDLVVAHVGNVSQKASAAISDKLGIKNTEKVPGKLSSSFETIKTGLSKLSAVNTGLNLDGEETKNKKSKEVKGDPNKPWFQAKIY